MKRASLLFVLFLIISPEVSLLRAQGEPFSMRVVTTGLNFPWEITWGPDGYIWTTERVGKRVTRVDPITGSKTTAITITEVYQSAGQDGLLGMALHPELLQGTGNDYVFVAYTYDNDPTAGVDRRTKLRRYTYNSGTQTLGSPVDIITNIPASNDHNSGRLKIGPDLKLYYTVGDLGANQFSNMCNTIRSQDIPSAAEVAALDWTKYQGKILRLNMDGSIPVDNPTISGVKSHIYSYGHRNAQGIVFGSNGKLYADEHGPKSDDEINLIQAGKNYGWPRVAGAIDGDYYEYANWSASSPTPCASLTYSDYTIPASVPRQSEFSFSSPDFEPPMRTIFTVDTAYNFQDPLCSGNYFICWPTVAPSSIDIYENNTTGIPGWANSLMVISLKKGRMYRFQLSSDGNSITADTVGYWYTQNRYRDITLNPDGITFYVSTDNTGSTSGPSGGSTSALSNPGAILEFTYTGTVLDLEDNRERPRLVRDLIRIYPNPVQDVVHVHGIKELRKPLRAEIYDITGRLRKKVISSRNDFTIDLTTFEKGVYLLRLINGSEQEVQVEKIIKQ